MFFFTAGRGIIQVGDTAYVRTLVLRRTEWVCDLDKLVV